MKCCPTCKNKKVHPQKQEKRSWWSTACTGSSLWHEAVHCGLIESGHESCVHTFAVMSHSHSCHISWLSVHKKRAPQHFLLIWCCFPVCSQFTIQWKTRIHILQNADYFSTFQLRKLCKHQFVLSGFLEVAFTGSVTVLPSNISDMSQVWSRRV